ncbi:MAG TPA: asparagine synthase-related protein [Candidatus Omnitrophota bacterium]|nr:asparagine synthase-related protein [Candidatus Omnitrophota bacterium]HRZ15551.1 asparagine synthase-related protein [Candidatus Omnitrophota bacterium]
MRLHCSIDGGSCRIECRNHYRGYGPVETYSGLRIHVLGAPSLYVPCAGMQSAEVIAAPGNERSRLIVRELLKVADYARWGDHLSGNFLIAVESPGSVNLITDIGNSFHLFTGAQGDRLVFSTDIDRLAAELGTQDAIDLVSVTDYLIQKSIAFPYTFYRGIAEADFACCIRVALGSKPEVSRYRYWLPRSGEESKDSRDMEGLSRRLYAAAQRSVDEALAGRNAVGLFLSGGLDSRVLAALLVQRGVKATALTVCDDRNNEVDLAGEVARRAGFKHELLFRDADYYPRAMPAFLAAEGPHFNFIRCTFFGFRDEIARRGFDALIGGYMSDTLLKLHEANSFGSYLLGRHLGTLEHIDRRDVTHFPGGREYLKRFSGILREELLEEVAARRQALLEEWKQIRTDGSAWEWSRIWPFMRNKHNSNLTTHIGQYDSFEVFTHRDVAEVARLAAQEIKLNGRLFNRAFFGLLKPFRDIPLSVTMLPLYGNYRINEFVIGLKHFLPAPLRRIGHKKITNPLATQRSNQDFLKLWEISPGMRSLRKAYTPDTLEKQLRAAGSPALAEILDPAIGRVDCFHIRYTMLYLDFWLRSRNLAATQHQAAIC